MMTDKYLPKDAADYPKATAARTFMVETANRYAKEYEDELKNLTKTAGLQKKILAIQKNMAETCAAFASMAFTRTTWPEQIAFYTNRLNHSNILAPYEEKLAPLTEDERFAFIQYAHANWLLHNAFIDQHIAKLNTALAAGTPEKAMEDRIILGTIYSVCREWRTWWKENGTADFDEWTYEDSPWEAEA